MVALVDGQALVLVMAADCAFDQLGMGLATSVVLLRALALVVVHALPVVRNPGWRHGFWEGHERSAGSGGADRVRGMV